MILTDRFVYIHMPKTGGTFVTRAIERAHAAEGLSRPLNVDKHGFCRQIPPSHRHLPIVSNVRNPFDRYVSYYEYAWWRKHEMPGISRREIREMLPHYPDISFAEFVELASAHFTERKTPDLPVEDRPGYYTERFVDFYFRDPPAALAEFGRAYVEAGRHRDDMCEVRFLRTERLAGDLAGFLSEVGYGPAAAAAVAIMGRIHPPRVRLRPRDWLLRYRPRRRQADWRAYYTPELADLVRRREWFLFALFPEFDAALS